MERRVAVKVLRPHLVGAGYLAWDWVTFRIKNGMRF
jgi:hypothetical protein